MAKRSSDAKCSVPTQRETSVSREKHRNESEQASPFIYLTDSRRERERYGGTPTQPRTTVSETAAVSE